MALQEDRLTRVKYIQVCVTITAIPSEGIAEVIYVLFHTANSTASKLFLLYFKGIVTLQIRTYFFS